MSEADVQVLRWRSLPRHLLVLAMAFAGGQHGAGSVRAAGLMRSLTVQLICRTMLGQVLVLPGRAVLMWSVVQGPSSSPAAHARETLGQIACVVVASAAGGMLALASFAAVLVPADLLLRFVARFTWRDALITVFAAGALSAMATGKRALSAYLANRDWVRHMTIPAGVVTWRLDLLGAVHQGHGYGGRVLDEFLRRADAAGAQVYLVTSPRQRGFYRRHGLYSHTEFENGTLLMHRRLVEPAAAAGVRSSPAGGTPRRAPTTRRR